jgi:hypothetical protein
VSDRLQARKALVAPREIELSDGGTVLVRPVKIENLLINRTIPVTLMRQMQAVKPNKDGTYKEEDAIKMAEAIDAVFMAAVVDPKVTREGGDDSAALDDFAFSDRVKVFEEVNRPSAALQSFRGQPNGNTHAALGSEDLRPAA